MSAAASIPSTASASSSPFGHGCETHNAIRFKDITGESYLRRIDCEYRDDLRTIGRELGVDLRIAYRSERGDRIQTMVRTGMGICFVPDTR